MLLAVAALLAGCAAPRFYQRQILVLDPASEAHFEITYGDSRDCLWKQRWPGRYDVDRGPYRLSLVPLVRFADEPAELRLELRGDGAPRAVVRGADSAEDALAEGVRRYRLRPLLDGGAMTIEVLRDERRIGLEEVVFHAEQCRALLWR